MPGDPRKLERLRAAATTRLEAARRTLEEREVRRRLEQEADALERELRRYVVDQEELRRVQERLGAALEASRRDLETLQDDIARRTQRAQALAQQFQELKTEILDYAERRRLLVLGNARLAEETARLHEVRRRVLRACEESHEELRQVRRVLSLVIAESRYRGYEEHK